MNFSKEFFEWTGTEGEYKFSIKEVSSTMYPGDKREISCDGIGFISLFKEIDGTLMLEIKKNENDSIMKKFYEVKADYLNNH